MASTVGARDGRDQHRSWLCGGSAGSARWASCSRRHWRSSSRRSSRTCSGCLGWCVAVLSSLLEGRCHRRNHGVARPDVVDHRRVGAHGGAVVKGDRADHDRAGPDPDAVAQRRPALRVVADGDLLVDPAVAADGLRGDDRPDTVLDEQCGSDPVGFEGQRGRRPVQLAAAEAEAATATSGVGNGRACGTRSAPRSGRRIASSGRARAARRRRCSASTNRRPRRPSSAASERMTLHHNGYAQIRANASSIVRRSRAMNRS